MSSFKKAVRSQRKLRAAFDGPAGAGKTFTALRLVFALKAAGLASKVAVIDTENNSASLYAGEAPDGEPWEFDTLALKQFGPDQFTHALGLAVKEGYDAVVVDSLSHAWVGEGGALDLVDQKGGNKFAAWKDITPLQRRMVDAIIRSPAHVVVTMRSKTEYVLEEDEKGRKVPRKVGTAPVQRDGLEYEFDVYGSLDWSHQMKITKTRCAVLDNATAVKPGPAFWAPLFDWLRSAAPSDPAAHKEEPAKPWAVPPEEFEAAFAAQIDEARTEPQLAAVAPLVKEAFDAGSLRQPHRDRLAARYKARLAELKAAAAKGDPGPAPAVVAADDTKS